MFSQIVWWATNALEALILGHALRKGFLSKYPAFYFYVAYVLLESLARFAIYMFQPQWYSYFYWHSQLLSVAVGYAVIWEIYKQALDAYPGAARMAEHLLAIFFLLVVSRVATRALNPHWLLANTCAELEREVRTVQAVLLVAIIAIIAYYEIPVGRNLKGLFWGYAFYVGVSIVSLALRTRIVSSFPGSWHYIQPAAYLTTLFVWCESLWIYQPSVHPAAKPELELDCEAHAEAMGRILKRVRIYITKAVQP